MREIKFRAWGPNQKYMWSWEELRNSISLDWLFSGDGEKIIMQFTGLRDKNGKEIFEGDIVYYETLAEDDPARAGKYVPSAAVEFFQGVYRIWLEYTWRVLSVDIASGALEVIGNIYENSDLLTNI